MSRLVDEVRPDTIVTFGPDGMTGHSDQRRKCSNAARFASDTRKSSSRSATGQSSGSAIWSAGRPVGVVVSGS